MTNISEIKLSPLSPDFTGIFNELLTTLQQTDTADNPTGWNNLSQSGTGITLIRFMASIGAFGQGSIARALQENYLDTARSPSGILRVARLQGVHIIRDRPGSINVDITRTDSNPAPLTIPLARQWTVGGQSFYNGNSLTLPSSGSTISATLTRGVVNTSVEQSDGTARQIFILGTSNAWDVSDIPLWAIDSLGTIWSSTRVGLWRYGILDQVFFESTLPDGTVECKFGDGTYGAIPPAGNLTFFYVSLATTNATNVSPPIGAAGSVYGISAQCFSTSTATPNQDHPKPDFYKTIGPGGPANKYAVSTRDDHRARALQYSGVVDAIFQGQAEMNPSDIRWMNVIAVTLLTSSPWTEPQWIAFKQYFETIGIATTSFIRMDPKPIPIDLTINIAVKQTASISTIHTLAQRVINNYFTSSSTSLGFTFQPSDLILEIMASATYLEAPGEAGAWIDYINIASPLGPVQCSLTQYLTLANPPTINVSYSKRGINSASTGAIVGL